MIDDFLPIIMIVMIDWIVNFFSTIIFMSLSFLFRFESSPIDTILDKQTYVELFIFFINITIKNLILVNYLKMDSQMIPYDIQLLEA